MAAARVPRQGRRPVRRMSKVARRALARPPDATVRAVVREVERAFLAWARALVELVVREIVAQEARPGARPALRADATLWELLDRIDPPKPRTKVLERAVESLEAQAQRELVRAGVPRTARATVQAPVTQAQKAQWIRRNVDLIGERSDMRRRIERVLYDPLNRGLRVEEIAKLLGAQVGFSASRARLVARDQTLKLYGQIQQERQERAGITEYVWTTADDERVRPDHAELDGSVQRWDNPPIVDWRTMRREHPGGDFQCVPGSAQIGFTSRVDRAFRRWHCGQLTSLVTDTGITLETTPNHPVLTLSGWKPAQAVQVGDYVVEASEHGANISEANIEHREAPASDLFEALSLAFGSRRPRAVAPQFHDDMVVDQEIDVVDIDGVLRGHAQALLQQRLPEFDFALAEESAARFREADLVLSRVGTPTHCGVGGLRDALAVFLRRAREASQVGGASVAWLHALTDEECADGLAVHAVALGEAFHRGALPLQLQAFIVREGLRVVRRQVYAPPSVESSDALAQRLSVAGERLSYRAPRMPLGAKPARVVEVRLRDFSGHVFNLSTESNWFVAQRLFIHNCRCTAVPLLSAEQGGRRGV